MKHMKKKGFTLVELIVVITILSILGTIAFISVQSYGKDARDSVRTADINNIQKSLELYMIQTGQYPLPDNAQSVTYTGELVYLQGTVGTNVTQQLGPKITKTPLDPLYNTQYIYSVSNTQKEYEVMAVYEGNVIPGIVSKANADAGFVKINGNYNQLYVQTTNYIVPLPSIITAEKLPLALNNTTIKSQVTTGQNNIPQIGSISSQTGSLTLSLLVYTGSINKNSSDRSKIEVIKKLQTAYSGSSAISGNQKTLLSKTTNEQILEFINLGPLRLPLSEKKGWWALDKNCNQPDIEISGQVWAGCNSTFGSGTEWGQTEVNIGTLGYSGSVGSCYDYNANNNVANCTIGSSLMSSTSNSKTFFQNRQPTGFNLLGDIEFDTIWGKFYTWSNTLSACPDGWHLPSDNEWNTIEQNLGCTDQTLMDWRCSGLGWKFHNTKNTTNNIAEALIIPLSGRRNINGTTFEYRGHGTHFWASTDSGSTAYSRYVDRSGILVRRELLDKLRAFNVRCIKN